MDTKVVKRIDLQGVICPLNFVKTKLALEGLQPGERLEVVLDEGEAMLNVPRSLKEEGHRILRVDPLGRSFRLIVERGEP